MLTKELLSQVVSRGEIIMQSDSQLPSFDPVHNAELANMQVPNLFEQFTMPTDIQNDSSIPDADPDMNKSFQQIVVDNGFIFEQHPVTTKDGYKLTIFRIRSKSTPANAPVVFLQHGVVDQSDCWIIHRADVAPAFQLVRAGYDVWLGNQRGTKYSNGHNTLDPKGKAYWQFSFTELGEYDAPAFIEYALGATGQKKATYIGHSQGTSEFFYALQAHPDYWKEKVNLFVALAPVTSLHNTSSALLQVAAKLSTQIKAAADLAHVWSVFTNGVADFVSSQFCVIVPDVCNAMQVFISSHDPTLDDASRFQVYMGHYPAASSIQAFLHYA